MNAPARCRFISILASMAARSAAAGARAIGSLRRARLTDHRWAPIRPGRVTVNSPVCRYNGVEVFRAEMGSGIAANPYLQFHTVAEASGEFVFDWIDDEGKTGSERAQLVVRG